MDFSIPSPLAATLANLRRFVDEHVIPLEPVARAAGFHALEPRLRELRARALTSGWWLPQLAREHGGMGLSVLEHGLMSEVLGRSPLGHYVLNCQAPDAGNMELLLAHGSEAQRERWLAPLLAGEIRSCFAMTEPEYAGSNPVWMGTHARREGHDWIIDGHKWFCTAADGAAFAIVMAVTEPEAAAHERASMIIVPTDAPGFTRVRNIPVMGEAGEGWMSHAELELRNVRVPSDHLLGSPGQGFALAQARLGPGRIHHGMRWIGLCERAFDEMARRAVSRKLSPDQRLGDTQTVQHWIAESRAQIDAARLLVLHAAWRIDRVGAREAREEISLIKFHTADVLMKVVDRAIQCHGALGITEDTVLSWIYRHERGARIYDGPDEVHKTVVARRILRRYRAPAPRPVALDEAKPVREGEALDLGALEAYLERAVPELTGALEVEQFPSGYSNLTYLLRKGPTELVLRRPPAGVQVKSGHDMAREHRVLLGLQGIYPLAPRPLAYCEDAGVIGAPFYVMERRRGVILRKRVPKEVEPATLRTMCGALVDQLAALHAVDLEAAGLADLGRPQGYVRRQVEGWIERFARAKTSEVPDIERLGEWLLERIPPDGEGTLVHNDFKFDNVMLDPDELTRIVAVLDWELCTVGDPLMDLGTTLGYWVQQDDDPRWQAMAFGPTNAPGAMTRRELIERYAERTGRDVSNMLFYYGFALLKIAGIVQQIYFRWAKGFTRDPRFAMLDQVVLALGATGVRAIATGKV